MSTGRATRLDRLPGTGPTHDGNSCCVDPADRNAIDFTRTGLSHRDRDGGSDLRLLQHIPAVASLLLRNDPLDGVWRESEMPWSSPGEPDSTTWRISREPAALHRAMQGRTRTFPSSATRSSRRAAFEAQLTGTGCPR